ncbi:snoRNP protein GAR1 [Perkinsela sp. CCAP 1560/4]|nr:snoRNP protein GAR1 [Perkinsela sp. CCAP 1560/4]|eukprot:KNH05269.1 snoRNP protein GAR1 [Perkinsela sp. CCAP 1560/4]
MHRGRSGGFYGRGNRGGRDNRGMGQQRFGGNQRGFEPDPPERVELIGKFIHACEDKLIYQFVKSGMVPRFNSFVYTESKKKVGKVDEVLGATDRILFSVIPEVGILPESVRVGATICMSPTQLTPLFRFTSPPSNAGKKSFGQSPGRGRGRGRGMRGSRGTRGYARHR